MQLNTRCPACETAFPVSLEQLQLRKGYIRCPQCAHIFDGFEAAVPTGPGQQAEAPAQAAVEPVIPPPSVSPVAPESEERPAHQGFIIPPPERFQIDSPEPEQPFTIGAGRQPAPDKAFIISDPRARSAGRQEPAVAGGTAADDEPLFVEAHTGRRSGRHEPEFLGRAQRQQAWLKPVWLILILFGLVLLAGQGVYVYRVQLANSIPALRPSLEAACERPGCSVPYERHIDAIAITGSALHSSGPPEDEVSHLTLEITLRNLHERPQEWPTLVLDLKDASGTVVVRRNLGPDIWVPAELRDGPFAADSELRVHLPVAVRGVQANGYQLDKFFP